MELKLNIYNNTRLSEIEKTYTCNDFAISVAVAEDILDLVNIDMFTGNLTEEDQLKALVKLVICGKDKFKDLVKNVFPELTDDELKRTNLKEFVKVLYDIVVYTIAGLTSVSDSKN